MYVSVDCCKPIGSDRIYCAFPTHTVMSSIVVSNKNNTSYSLSSMYRDINWRIVFVLNLNDIVDRSRCLLPTVMILLYLLKTSKTCGPNSISDMNERIIVTPKFNISKRNFCSPS